MNRNHLAGPRPVRAAAQRVLHGRPANRRAPAPTVSSSTLTNSHTTTGPFAVLRTDSFEAQFSAERVGVDPAGVIAALTCAKDLDAARHAAAHVAPRRSVSAMPAAGRDDVRL